MRKNLKLFLTVLLIFMLSCVAAICGCAGGGEDTDKTTPVPIEITLSGAKTQFEYGEEFNSDGLTVKIILSDDTERAATENEYTVTTDYSKNTAGNYTVTVKLKDFDVSNTYTVTVAEKNQPAPIPVPIEITLSGAKTQFEYGEEFNSDGLTVKIILSDDTERAATENEYTVTTNYDKNTAGSYTVTVKLKDFDVSDTYTVTVAKEPHWSDDGVLKILAIGNSFSDDMMQYVYEIATGVGIEKVYLGNLYIGGCSLDTHAANAVTDSAAYEYRVNSDGSWNTTFNYKLSTAISSQDWDFITLQQASGSSGIESTYSNLSRLVTYVKSQLPDETHTRLAWHMTWAYQGNSTHADFPKYDSNQMKMYEMIVSTVRNKIISSNGYEDFAYIIPNGTAIQNARTSFLGDSLTRDGYHLTYDTGRYIAGLTLVETLTGYTVDNIAFAPSGVDGYYKSVAIESAKNAVKTPFEITPSIYDEEKVFDFDLNNYNEFNYELTQGFYNATDKVNYGTIITTDANLSSKFFATERFTPDTLPVGSLILLEAGWVFRPEAWIKDVAQTIRPDEISPRFLEITPEFWSGYNFRAFNISRQGRPVITGQESQARNAFRILIPKTPVNYDETYFVGAGYRKLEYELTQGFWNSTDATNYGSIITNNATLSKKFFATKRFAPEELPVGTVLVLAGGWNYRSDHWETDAKQNSRPDTVTARLTVIDENFWNGYIYRSFNLNNGEDLTGKESEVKAAFTIWLPPETN